MVEIRTKYTSNLLREEISMPIQDVFKVAEYHTILSIPQVFRHGDAGFSGLFALPHESKKKYPGFVNGCHIRRKDWILKKI